MKKIVIAFIITVLILNLGLFSIASAEETETILISGITITTDSGEDTVEVGSTLQMLAQVEPADALSDVVWSVSNSEKATIDENGLLTGVLDGTVTVTATAADGSEVTSQKEITVTAMPQEPAEEPQTEPVLTVNIIITTETEDDSVEVGSTLQMLVQVEPAEALSDVVWSVSDSEKATIDENGLLTGVLDGTVTVTATAADGSEVTSQKEITVTAMPQEPAEESQTEPVLTENIIITTETGEDAVAAGSTLQLFAQVEPADALSDVVWSVSDSEKATIDENGLLIGVLDGTVTVTATAADGSEVASQKEITVTAMPQEPAEESQTEPVLTENIIITTETGEDAVAAGSTLQLFAQVEPAEALSDVVWSVSDSEKATIDENGLLTGVLDGTVTVTATAADGSEVASQKEITVMGVALNQIINMSEATQNAVNAPSYTVIIPATINVGKMEKDSGIIKREFSIEARNVVVEAGRQIKVSVISDFIMKDKNGTGLALLNYFLKNSLSVQIASGTTLTTFTEDRKELSTILIDTSEIIRAGKYKGIMDFVIVYD